MEWSDASSGGEYFDSLCGNLDLREEGGEEGEDNGGVPRKSSTGEVVSGAELCTQGSLKRG